jgi:hypothetical protein
VHCILKMVIMFSHETFCVCPWILDWSKVRRNKVLLVAVRAVCVVVLTWGCIESIVTSMTLLVIWTWTTLTQPTSSFTWHTIWHPIWQHRDILLQCYGALRLRLDPVLFTMKALGTLVLVPYFENLVCTIESVCFSREYRTQYPLISRLQGLLFSFFLTFALIRIVTIWGIYAGTCLGLAKQWLMSVL